MACDGRGRFILFEGCDGVGKTTQQNLLVNYLNYKMGKSSQVTFPHRGACVTGSVIDDYLKKKKLMDLRVITMMFSANRWEMASQITSLLNEGFDVVADRYIYSGVAYAMANDLDKEWVLSLDKGLPKPDIVLYLSRQEPVFDKDQVEIYDDLTFQQKVKRIFEQHLFDESFWVNIDTSDKTVSETHIEIVELIDTLSINKDNKEIGKVYCSSVSSSVPRLVLMVAGPLVNSISSETGSG